MKNYFISAVLSLVFLAGTCLEGSEKGSPDILNYANILSKKKRETIKKRYGENLRGVEEFKDVLLIKYIREYPLYKINVFNPASFLAGRTIFLYSAAPDGDNELVFLEKSKDVQAFIQARMDRKKLSDQKAMDLALVYVKLRRIDMLQSIEDYKKQYNHKELTEKEEQIKPPCMIKEDKAYHITFFAVTDPAIYSFSKIEMIVSIEEFSVTETFIACRGVYD
ncbi:MAG: hypothetical protein PHF84_02775 [bacterium]|nr:hypothetical protein [bacterium]